MLWKHLYNTKSATESGTLYLRNRINRKASEDYLSLMVSAHVIVAAKNLISEKNFDKATDLATAIVNRYIRLPRADDKSVPNMEYYCMLLKCFLWDYCGTGSTMPLRKQMVIEY